jgi:hypothetical protein
MNFKILSTNNHQKYMLGIDEESGKKFAAIPVGNQMADYEEYYWVDDELYSGLENQSSKALEFIQKCRNREMDSLLVLPPGRDRGTPR